MAGYLISSRWPKYENVWLTAVDAMPALRVCRAVNVGHACRATFARPKRCCGDRKRRARLPPTAKFPSIIAFTYAHMCTLVRTQLRVYARSLPRNHSMPGTMHRATIRRPMRYNTRPTFGLPTSPYAHAHHRTRLYHLFCPF